MARAGRSLRQDPRTARGRRAAALGAAASLAGVLALLLANAAAAAPVDLRFTGDLGVVDDKGVTDVEPAEGNMFTDTGETVLSLTGSEEIDATLGSGTDADPHRGLQEWTITNVSDATEGEGVEYEELWAVFLGHFDEEDPFYDDLGSDLGLRVDEEDDWRLIRGRSTGKLFPARFVGGLAPGVSKTFTTDYIVATELTVDGGERVWPNLRTGYALAPIPEPGTAALLVTGLAGLAAAGRRRC